jgi:hypothetical protein
MKNVRGLFYPVITQLGTCRMPSLFSRKPDIRKMGLSQPIYWILRRVFPVVLLLSLTFFLLAGCGPLTSTTSSQSESQAETTTAGETTSSGSTGTDVTTGPSVTNPSGTYPTVHFNSLACAG